MLDYGFVVTVSLLVLKVYALAPVTWFMVFIPFGIGIVLELVWLLYKMIFRKPKQQEEISREITINKDGMVDLVETRNGVEIIRISHGELIYSTGTYYRFSDKEKTNA